MRSISFKKSTSGGALKTNEISSLLLFSFFWPLHTVKEGLKKSYDL
jgi:hypothetical protein